MIKQREVKDYEAYKYEQGGKARNIPDKFLKTTDRRIKGFISVFQKAAPYMNAGYQVLCLGARTGCEVEAAIKCGFPLSVGIDLHPLSGNVIEADWHYMPFRDNAFQNVFTNCLDHCADLKKLAHEIRRVLGMDGVFVFTATDRSTMEYEQWAKKPNNEYLFWDNPDGLRMAFEGYGFEFKYKVRLGKKPILYVMRVCK